MRAVPQAAAVSVVAVPVAASVAADMRSLLHIPVATATAVVADDAAIADAKSKQLETSAPPELLLRPQRPPG